MDVRTLTRLDLAESLADKTGVAQNEAAKMLEDMLGLISDVLDKEGELKISRFGLFKVLDKNARIGRNPKTKRLAAIDARRVVTFKPSNMLRAKVESANGAKYE